MSGFTARQVELLRIAQTCFIAQHFLIFPLYYLPGVRGLLGGDGKSCKLPCSISWMTRKGLPRLVTLVMWNFGWMCMCMSFLKSGDFAALSASDWMRALFLLQMYATGFVTVVLTPLKGPDVALGSADALHCYSAIIYVADHYLANQFVLGVHLLSPFGLGFILTSMCCGLFQFLRADNDLFARKLHARAVGKERMSLNTFTYILEWGFMIFENALFIIFLFGMTSGLH